MSTKVPIVKVKIGRSLILQILREIDITPEELTEILKKI